jgi:fatty-acyl-CoA synthase
MSNHLGDIGIEHTLHSDWQTELGTLGPLTLGGLLLEVCDRYADNEALVFYENPTTRISWTYLDLRQHAIAFAKGLIAAGSSKGTRVGIAMGSRPECVAAIYGSALAGAIVVPLSTLSTSDELRFLIKHADIDYVVSQTLMGGKHKLLEMITSLCPQAADENVLYSNEFPYLKSIIAFGATQSRGSVACWDDFMGRGEFIDTEYVLARNSEVTPADIGLISYSSGTTSEPKGMMHTHRAPALQAWTQAKVFERTEESRVWSTFPLFWTGGFNTVLGATLAAGGCWVMQEIFEAGESIALVAREKVNEPFALPHLTGVMEEHPDWKEADFSSIRYVNPNTPFTRHPSVTNLDPNWHGIQAYGSSETCAISITHCASTPLSIANNSSGRLLPGNVLRIIDSSTGEILCPDMDGEICIKGPTLMNHYVKKNAIECFDSDGFFHSGDSGYYDKDGYIHWTGRQTDMIKTAGANVSPAELEKVIFSEFPTLKFGRVVGVRDERLGQIVVLCIVPHADDKYTEAEIQKRLRAHVANYKVPKRVLFFDEEDIPMTANGEKVKTGELRELAESRLA